MRQSLALGLLCLLSVAACADEVVLRDAAHGASLIYSRVSESGSIVETQTWSIGATSRIIKTMFDSSGRPRERSVSVTRGLSTQRTDATLDDHGATVVATGRNGPGPASHIPLANRQTILDPSVNWFVDTKPDKGATSTFMSFDPEFRYWEEVTATFEGRGSLDKSPEGNLVTRKAARSTVRTVLDDKGMPLAWDDGRLHLVRSGKPPSLLFSRRKTSSCG